MANPYALSGGGGSAPNPYATSAPAPAVNPYISSTPAAAAPANPYSYGTSAAGGGAAAPNPYLTSSPSAPSATSSFYSPSPYASAGAPSSASAAPNPYALSPSGGSFSGGSSTGGAAYGYGGPAPASSAASFSYTPPVVAPVTYGYTAPGVAGPSYANSPALNRVNSGAHATPASPAPSRPYDAPGSAVPPRVPATGYVPPGSPAPVRFGYDAPGSAVPARVGYAAPGSPAPSRIYDAPGSAVPQHVGNYAAPASPAASRLPPAIPSQYASQAAEAERARAEYAARLAQMEAELRAQKEQQERGAQEAQRLANEAQRARMMADERVRREQERAHALEAEYQRKLLQQQQNAALMEREKAEMQQRLEHEYRAKMMQAEQQLLQEKARLEQQQALQQQQMAEEKRRFEQQQQQQQQLQEEKRRLEQQYLQQQQQQAEERKRAEQAAEMNSRMEREKRELQAKMEQDYRLKEQQLMEEKARMQQQQQQQQQLLHQQQQQQQQQAAAASAAASAASAASAVPTRASWEINAGEVRLERQLGEGSFGLVFLARLHGKPVAAKKLKGALSPAAIEAFKAELEVMARLRHPNLLLFMGACLELGHLMIVTDYLPRGSLAGVLHSAEPLSFGRKMRFARDIVSGLAWLHGQRPPVVHRDLKPENCLVAQNWSVVLADFGLAQFKAAAPGDAAGKGFGSPFYMAPELLLEKAWGPAVDTYAFGVTLWEIVMRKTPFVECESLSDLVDEVAIGGSRPSPLPSHPPELPLLMQACWDADPSRRPSVVESLSEGLAIDMIMLADAVPDKAARDFWGSCFLRRTPNDIVPFSELLEAFAAFFRLAAPLAADDLGALCLRALVANEQGDVVLEDFGRSTRFFPPFGPAALAKMRDTLSAGWFHGPVSRAEGEAALARARKAGCYLIRYAQEDECEGEGGQAVLMLCVAGQAGVPIVVTAAGFDFRGQHYASLDEVLMKNRKPLGLSIPCIGSKFDAIPFPEEA